MNELIYKAKTDSQTRHLKTNLGLPKGKRGDKLGVWDYQMQTTIYKIDRQQGPAVQSELYSIFAITYMGKESEKGIYIHILYIILYYIQYIYTNPLYSMPTIL